MKLIPLKIAVTILCALTTQTNAIPIDTLISAAKRQTTTSTRYDPTYFVIPYPNGDVPSDKGVCTDVVIRAYRALGIDLQQLVHEDMKANFPKYPKLWGLRSTDTNIDHRRVPNLAIFFSRHGETVKITDDPKDYKPGDIVTWNLRTKGSLPHIGIVSDIYAENSSRPLIIHNIGAGPEFEDILFSYKITGHYRYSPSQNKGAYAKPSHT
jgi:uncharacterized protein YijF (DUF1287 family)